MRLQVTFKTPYVIEDALDNQLFYCTCCGDNSIDCCCDGEMPGVSLAQADRINEQNEKAEEKKAEIKKFIDQFVFNDEYVTIVFDTEAKTATVIKKD